MLPALSAGACADQACCDQLAGIGFASNLPVVIIDTLGVQLTRDKVNASLCTCSDLPKGDYSGDIETSLRGGENTREPPFAKQHWPRLHAAHQAPGPWPA